MAKPWKEVEQSQAFQALNPAQKVKAQQQYFDQVVAPKAGANAEMARTQFFNQYNYYQPKEEPSIMDKVSDWVTGDDRVTNDIAGLKEIGSAPELNELSLGALKSSLGLLATGDEDKESQIIKANFPDAKIRTDSKGNKIATLPSGEYVINKPGLSGQDVIGGVFDLLAFTPAGRAATIPSMAAKSAATEAALQGATSATGADVDIGDAATNVALSGALGGAGKAVEDLVGAGYRLSRGAGEATTEAENVAKFAKDQDLPLMTTDVNPPTTFAGRTAQAASGKIPVVGTGAKRAQQQEARSNLVNEYVQKFGDYRPEDVYSSLERNVNRTKRAAGRARQSYVDQVSDIPVAGNNAIDAINDEITRLTTLPNGQPRSSFDNSTVDQLIKYRDDLSADPSFANFDALRTQFREDVKGERNVINNRSQAAINKIYGAMSKDMDSTIETNLGSDALNKWKRANRAYAGEVARIKDTRLKTALQKGELTPEVVNNLLFSKKKSEVQNLYKSLDAQGKKAAQAGLIGKAIQNTDGSPDRFINNLKKLSDNTGIVFKGQDKEYLDGLKKYLEYTKEAAKAGVTTKTGQELIQLGAPAALITDLQTSGGIGTAATAAYAGLSRAYESPMARDAILKLKRYPKGSSEFEKALRNVNSIFTSLAQTARRQSESQE